MNLELLHILESLFPEPRAPISYPAYLPISYTLKPCMHVSHTYDPTPSSSPHPTPQITSIPVLPETPQTQPNQTPTPIITQIPSPLPQQDPEDQYAGQLAAAGWNQSVMLVMHKFTQANKVPKLFNLTRSRRIMDDTTTQWPIAAPKVFCCLGKLWTQNYPQCQHLSIHLLLYT